MKFSTRLKEEIEFADLRYKELAEKSGVPERALYNYVATKNPSMPPADVAVKIAKVLGVSVEYLVTGEKFNCDECISQNSNFVHADAYSTKEERNLLKNFMELSERDKGTILALAEHLRKDTK